MNLKSLTIICMFLAATVFIPAAVFAGGSAGEEEPCWPRWRGPNGDGVSTETDWDPGALARGPKLLWENRSMCNDVGTCVRVDRHLYGSNGFSAMLHLRCIDFYTGEMMWEQEMHRGGTVAVATAGETLLVLEDDGNLHTVEATPEAYREISSCQLPSATGKHKWWTPPVLYRGRIYCRNYLGDLVCIDVSGER